ncbi:MAG: hypothetical protein AB9842_12670 [Bacteroidales bacterium]
MSFLKSLRQRPDYLFIIITGIIVLWVHLNINGKKDYSKGLLESDARGYYAYLPAVFIYQDLNLGFFDTIEKSTYYNPNLFYEFRAIHNGHTINKYYAGTALCLSPFFLTGHLITSLSSEPRDGYSKYYVKSVALASVFYLVLSLFLLNALLKKFSIEAGNRILALAVMVFGTNLFYYNIAETCLSHVYSLAFFSLFLYAAVCFFRSPGKKYLFLIGFSLGMIVLIRPVNFLILLSLPFAAGSFTAMKQAWQWICKNLFPLATTILIFILIISIQLLIYKIQTGSWILYSYKGEGFNFSDPNLIPILFSYKKGLFLYTPVYLISLTGLYFLFRNDRFRFWAWVVFFIVVLYVISSWYNWYYGGSFSGRVFIEFLPFFVVPLAMALHHMRHKGARKMFIGLLFLLTVICQLQTYQYRRGQIHWSDQTREKYWENFLGHKKLEKLF